MPATGRTLEPSTVVRYEADVADHRVSIGGLQNGCSRPSFAVQSLRCSESSTLWATFSGTQDCHTWG
jgi:hypothetical protein